MKKLYFSLAALAAFSVQAGASAPQADSTAVADSITAPELLSEFTVEGRTQRVIKHGVEYIPDKKIKRMAYNASTLLMHMQIPQLNVSPADMTIKTAGGQSVSVFIDFRPASSSDLQALRPQDVLRVEVLSFPDDPRFNGEQNVVNFIMVKYDWGGYTKITASGNTLNNDKGDANVYSKFVYKNVTVDASGGGSMSHSDKTESSVSQTYRDVMFRGRHYDYVKRTETSDAGDYLVLGNSQWAVIRADLQSDNSFIRHSAYFSRSGTPRSHSGSWVEFSDAISGRSHSETDVDFQSISPSISGYYYFQFAKKNALSLSWNFNYTANRRNALYRLDGFDPVINNNREEVYEPSGTLSYRQPLGHDNSFTAQLITYTSIYNTRYAGSYDRRQKLLSSENMLFLEYRQNWGKKISLYSRVGLSYVAGRINGENSLNQWNPRLGLDLQYEINSRNNAEIQFWWGNSHPMPSTANTALVQRNELMWVQGNPDLRNTIFITGIARYTYIPSNKFSLFAELQYEGNPDKQALEYYSLSGCDGLVQRTVNSGTAHSYTARANARLILFDNSLTLSFYGAANRMVLTGIDSQSLNWLSANVHAQYSYRNFIFSLYYNTPGKSLGAWSNGVRSSWGSTYGLYAGYNMGNLNVSVRFINWFDGDSSVSSVFGNPRFSSFRREWNSSLARSLSLTLVYTFGYGKKVGRNNELQGGASGSSSAILK